MEHPQRMPTEREPDKNDLALAQYFVRGMRRFGKYVPAETVEARIEAAYHAAHTQFAATLQKGQP